LLSARDIKEWVERMLFTALSDEDFVNLMLERHQKEELTVSHRVQCVKVEQMASKKFS